jgi:hypothetical protein
MKHRTPKSNEVLLDSSGIPIICYEGAKPNKMGFRDLQGETILP